MSSQFDDVFNRDKAITQLQREIRRAVKAACDRNEPVFYIDRIGIENFWTTVTDVLTQLAANAAAHTAVRFSVRSDFFPHMAESYRATAENAQKQISDDILKGKTKLWNP